MKYDFGEWCSDPESGVEIPMLDAFKNEMNALCARYGVSFEHERVFSEYDHSEVRLVPYNG